MSKTATIFAPAPTKDVRMAIVPIGMYANREIQQLDLGGEVTMQDTWRKTDFRLVRRCKIPVKSSIFNFLLRALYGETMTYERFMERWQGVAVSEDWGKDCFSDEVLLIELQNL